MTELNRSTDLSASLQDPAAFDVEGWLQDAKLPEESATVYKRADVVAELSDLKRRIELEARAASPEYTAADPALTPLEKEYQALLETFSKSALTVYVRALTDDERNALRAAHDERTKDWKDPIKANAAFGYDLLAGAITHMTPAGGKKASVKLTPAQVEAMENAIGNTQMQVILAARQTAQNALPAVDADFLLKRSGTEAGAE